MRLVGCLVLAAVLFGGGAPVVLRRVVVDLAVLAGLRIRRARPFLSSCRGAAALDVC